ncbi:hypothetical protein B0T25DRAFT_545241 [Lasiosphaeria hispida]|uniref:Uncharacterized protein n=1 Tax=Lasiosphaeria hispida TaxID=260671 RepID=A0AAJ0HJV8_9PEZI|nr:hypothetical protein B0T25DRAFT_545241 [Lasiosphaeria hispida]
MVHGRAPCPPPPDDMGARAVFALCCCLSGKGGVSSLFSLMRISSAILTPSTHQLRIPTARISLLDHTAPPWIQTNPNRLSSKSKSISMRSSARSPMKNPTSRLKTGEYWHSMSAEMCAHSLVTRRQSPAFAIVDPDDPHGGRPRVIITQKPKYSVGRSVYVRVSGSAELQGPFLVATVTVSTAKYTLSYSSGIAAMSGSEIHEDDLVPG